jgi:hypothetical protein
MPSDNQEIAMRKALTLSLTLISLGAVIDTHVVRAMIEYATHVEISPEVGYYIVDLVHASRTGARRGGAHRGRGAFSVE